MTSRPRRRLTDLAIALGLTYCAGITKQGFYCGLDHQVGEAEDGIVHLADQERLTEAKLGRFLWLAAEARDPTLREDPPWRRTYRVALAVRKLAAEAHIRPPGRSFWAWHRAFVLASITSIPNREPLRRAAFDWARR